MNNGIEDLGVFMRPKKFKLNTIHKSTTCGACYNLLNKRTRPLLYKGITALGSKSFNSNVNTPLEIEFGSSKINTKFHSSPKRIHKLPKNINSLVAKEDSQEIDKLHTTLKSITLENKKLKQLSIEIMNNIHQNSEIASTVHSFYQNLVLPDKEQSVSRLEEYIQDLKTKIIDLTKTNNELRKENTRLKIIMMRYRKLATENLSEQNSSNHITKPRHESTIKSSAQGFDDKYFTTKFIRENAYLDMIANSFKRISKANTIRTLISIFYQELSILLNTCKVGIYIIDPNLQSIYKKEKGLVQAMLVNKMIIEYALNKNNVMLPFFTSIEMAKGILRTSNTISIPIMGLRNNELYLVLQIESRSLLKTQEDKEVWVKNEIVLRILSAYVGVLVDSFLHTLELESKGETQAGLLKFCSEISGERRQQYLINKIENELGGFLNFEGVSVLHFESGKLFTLQKLKSDSGRLIVDGFSELPLTLGLTGRALKEKKTIISCYSNNDITYDSKIDNILKLKQVNDMMVVPLFVSERSGSVLNKTNKELVGVLQLLNYLPGNITKINNVLH